MTTVAWRGDQMAADSTCSSSGNRTTAIKIHVVGEHVIGFCGQLQDCITFVEWWRGGKKSPLEFKQFRSDGSDAPDVEALVVGRDDVTRWTEHAQYLPVLDEFWAIGSGASAALAAMHMGADARQAIEVASKVDFSTGGAIQVVNIDDEIRAEFHARREIGLDIATACLEPEYPPMG